MRPKEHGIAKKYRVRGSCCGRSLVSFQVISSSGASRMPKADHLGEDSEAEWDDGYRPTAADTQCARSPNVAQANEAPGRHACADEVIIGPFHSQETGSLSFKDDNDAINSNRTDNRSEGTLLSAETAIKKRKILLPDRNYGQSQSPQVSSQLPEEENIQYNESLSAITSKSADQPSNLSDRNWQSSIDSRSEVGQQRQSLASSQMQSLGNMHTLSNIGDMDNAEESRQSTVHSDHEEEEEEEEYTEEMPALPSTHVMRTRGQARREMFARGQHDAYDDYSKHSTTATPDNGRGECNETGSLPRRKKYKALRQSKRARVDMRPVSSETGNQHLKQGLDLQPQPTLHPAHVESDPIQRRAGQQDALVVRHDVQHKRTEHPGPVVNTTEKISAASGNDDEKIDGGDDMEIARGSRDDVAARNERERDLNQLDIHSDQMIDTGPESEKAATSGRSSRADGSSTSSSVLGTRASENEQAAKQTTATNTFVTPCAKTLTSSSHAASTGIVKNVGSLASVEMKDHSKPSYDEAINGSHVDHTSIERHDGVPCTGTSRVTPTASHGQAEGQVSSDKTALAASQLSQMNKEARGDDEMSDVSTTILVDEGKFPAHRGSSAGAIIEAGVLDIAGFAELVGDIGNTKVQ